MSLLEHDTSTPTEPLALTFHLGFTADATPAVIQTVDRSELRLLVTILPNVTAASSQQTKFRMSADGTAISIKSFVLDAPSSSSGQRLDVVLANPTLKETVKAAAFFLFEIGLVDLQTGDTTWQPLFEDGTLSATQLTIAFGNNQPNDHLSISTLAPLTDRLNKAPDTDLIIYDPYRADVQPSPDILRDTAGNLYPDELLPISSLKLNDLFAEIFVSRCGFAAFKTNLPNYPIRLAQFAKDQGFFSGIAPHIGQFAPLVFEKDNEIWITDATISLPAGFPAPRDLHISRYRQLSISEQLPDLDGYILHYSESGSGIAAYYDIRVETSTESSGNIFDETYSLTTLKRTFKDFKPAAGSNVITSSQLWKEETTITGTFGDVLGKTELERFFDSFGRETKTVKKVSNRVPDVPLSTALVLKEVQNENYEVTYAAHPFERGKSFISQTVRSITGLIAVDSENQYLDQNFEQGFVDAHRTGNLSSSMTTRTGAIKKITEKVLPVSSSVVQTEVITEDLIRKVTNRSDSETKAGDVGIQTQTTKQRRLIVLSSDETARSGKPLQSLPVGELPLFEAIPLARRKLARAALGSGTVSVEVLGVDLSIRRGSVFNLIGRSAANLGVMLVEGFRITGDNLGTAEQKVSTSVQGEIIK